jgi:2-C-methyl-D-erythritol 4-phosphate cytidylyltransferase
MGGALPKVFLPLAGRPILLHSIDVLARRPCVLEIVVILPVEHMARAIKQWGEEMLRRRVTKFVPGGPRRQDSVAYGLEVVSERAGLVLVHDAARPLVQASDIDGVVRAARRTGAAVCGRPVRDTIKQVSKGRVVCTPDRREFWEVQTPQAFRPALLRRAFEKARRTGFEGTDCASLVEAAGFRVAVVPGSDLNIKITSPADLAAAEALHAFIRKP